MPTSDLSLHHADQHTANQIRDAIGIEQHIQELIIAKAAICRGIAETMGDTDGVVIDGRIVAIKTPLSDLKFIEPEIQSGTHQPNPGRKPLNQSGDIHVATIRIDGKANAFTEGQRKNPAGYSDPHQSGERESQGGCPL